MTLTAQPPGPAGSAPGPARPAALLGVGSVRHRRLRPAAHAFAYDSYFLMLPLRALRAGTPCDLPRNRRGWLSFHDRDHGDGGPDALAWFDALLEREGITDADGEVWLQTFPRVLGYVFKPVSFWYAHRRDGSLAAVLAEVNNTFGERHAYLLCGPELGWGRELRARKEFHVSPFCRVEGDYRFRFMRTAAGGTHTPADNPADAPAAAGRCVVRIDHHDGGGPLLLTSLSGRLEPLTHSALRRVFLGMPLMTLGVIARIHLHAARLWFKRVPFFSKPPAPRAFVTR